MRQEVESDPNAIGFLSNYKARPRPVNSVGYNGVACNKTTAASGQYAGVARVLRGDQRHRRPAPRRRSSTGSTSSAAARKIIASQWVPITR